MSSDVYSSYLRRVIVCSGVYISYIGKVIVCSGVYSRYIRRVIVCGDVQYMAATYGELLCVVVYISAT